MTIVLALDIATSLGWACGEVGGEPRFGTELFGQRDASLNAVLANCHTWLADFLQPQPRPGLIILESLLPDAAIQSRTNRHTRDRLAGLHGIVRAVSFLRGIHQIATYPTTQVRYHFIGTTHLRRDPAKAATMERCRMLGWDVKTDDEADALALWDFACCIIDPKIGVRRTPLFFQRSSAANFNKEQQNAGTARARRINARAPTK